MKKVLVTYATMAGSTTEVALAVGEEIMARGDEVDILPMEKVTSLDGYDAVVLGAPMIMGWHHSALGFLRKNRKQLERLPLAIFALAMTLTSTGITNVNGVPVYADENLVKRPLNPVRPTFREHYADIRHYAAPILKAAGVARPVSLAFFGGRVEFGRLKVPAMLFVMFIIRAQPGDRRNWRAIRAWAGSLPGLFETQKQVEK